LPELAVVTGAFSYTGSFVAERLLADGVAVRTLSRRDDASHPLHGRVEVAELQFADEPRLVESLRGARMLVNTYWIRFERGGSTFDRAVENTRTLFRAARKAGVERVVHVSVSNPSDDSPLPYFRGKARCEQALAESGQEHTIVRPTLVFGPNDILVSNIAWILRRFPFFLVPGDGRYRVQPVSAQDVAELAVTARGTVDAAGPEVYTFDELVQAIGRAVGHERRLAHVPTGAALAVGAVVGAARRDVLLTRDEVAGLQDELLLSHEPPRGSASFGEWLAQSADRLGRRYVSELRRNFRPYAPL
jgi:NADH dehydrogenase